MSAPIRSIVVGVAALTADDPSSGPSHADPALASAAALARSTGATLHLVHAYELPFAESTLLPVDTRRRYAAALEARVSALAASCPGTDLECHVVEGSPAAAVCDAATHLDVDLIVVGATRRGRAWRGLVGSTADGVIRASTIPVLVLHQPLALPICRVLLTTDLSEASEASLARGVDTVHALAGPGPDLRLVRVVASDPLVPPPYAAEAAARLAEPGVRRLAQRIGIIAETTVRTGNAALEIAREADEWKADLLVLGTHGRSGFRQLWLGGTAISALRAAACNVLMVPPHATPLPDAEGVHADAGVLAGVA